MAWLYVMFVMIWMNTSRRCLSTLVLIRRLMLTRRLVPFFVSNRLSYLLLLLLLLVHLSARPLRLGSARSARWVIRLRVIVASRFLVPTRLESIQSISGNPCEMVTVQRQRGHVRPN